MRLIDADALGQLLEVYSEKDSLGHTPVQLCDAMPTVDAVEVVRCRDCEYYVETNGRIGTCELTISGAKDDGFCAWGERKNDAAD